MPTAKGTNMESSLQPLTKLLAPLLFVQPGQDPFCNGLLIRENVDRMPSSDIRMIELPVRSVVGDSLLHCQKKKSVMINLPLTHQPLPITPSGFEKRNLKPFPPPLICQDTDGSLRTVPPGGVGKAQGPLPQTIKIVMAAITKFVSAVTENRQVVLLNSLQ